MKVVIADNIRQAELSLNKQGESYSSQLNNYLVSSYTVLKGFSAIFSTIRKHEYNEIKQYVNDVIKDNPQIFALEVVQKVNREQLMPFVATMRREVSPAYTIKSFSYETDRKWQKPEEKSTYYPLVFMEPLRPGSEDVLGLDMDSVPFLKEPMLESIKSGVPVMSTPFKLVEGTNAYVVFSPISKESQTNSTSSDEFLVLIVIDIDHLVMGQNLTPSHGEEIYLHHKAFSYDDPEGQLLALSGEEVSFIEKALFPNLVFKKELSMPGGQLTLLMKHRLGLADLNLGLLLLIIVLSVSSYLIFKTFLYRREVKHRALIENLQDLILILDKDGVNVWNSPAVRRFGMKPTDAIGVSAIEYAHPDDKERLKKTIDYVVQHPGEVVTLDALKAVTPNGDTVYLTDTFQYLPDTPGINGIVVVVHDVTKQKEYEKQIHESEERYKTFINHASEGIYRIDMIPPVSITLPKQDLIEKINQSAIVAEINDSLSEMYGLTVADMVGKPAVDFAPNYGERASLVLESDDLSVDDVETEDIDKDGKEIYLLESYHGEIFDNKLHRIWGMQRNITELKKASELLKVPFMDLIHPDDIKPTQSKIDEELKRGISSHRFVNRYRHKSGYYIWLEWTTNPNIEKGLLYAVARDITERKLFENKLTQANELYSDLANNKLLGIYRIRVFSKVGIDHGEWKDSEKPPFTFEFINEKFCQIFKLTRQELVKRPGFITDFVYEEDKAAWLDLNVKANRKKISFKWEGRFLIDGKICWLHLESLPRELESGDIIWTGICFDITKQKRVESALRDSKERFREMADLLPQPIWETNMEGLFTYTNRAGFEKMGYEAKGLKEGIHITELITPEDRQRVAADFTKVFRGEEVDKHEYECLKRDGATFPALIYSAPIFKNGISVGIRGITLDITDQKRIERELREAHKLFEGVIQQSPIPMAVASPDGELKIFNQAVIEQLGIDEASEIRQGSNLFEMKQTWKDYGTNGELLPVEELPLAQALQGKTVRNLEVRVVRSDGTERWEMVNGTPIYDDTGKLIAGFVSFPDITEQKHAEVTLKNYAETQTVLLREVNHRVKNNLAVIVGMLHKEYDRALAKGHTTYLPALTDLICRLQSLVAVHSMLSAANWQPLLLSKLCSSVVTEVLKAQDKEIEVNIASSTARVESNQAHHLAMVLNELTTNTVKYGSDESREANINITIQEDDQNIHLIYQDNGPGYPEDFLQDNLRKTGVGFDLITGIVRKSLRGAIAFKNDNGAVAEITFEKEVDHES
jgi:PAS domain S-box-containing protein